MNNDINLLHSKKRTPFSDLTTKLRLLRFGASVVLSIVVLLSMALFLLVVASPLPGLKEDENVLLNSLKTQHAKIAQHTLLTARLSDVRVIISQRAKVKEILELLHKDLPGDVTLQVFSYDEKVVRVQAVSVSLESLEAYLLTLRGIATEKGLIQSIQMNSLTLTGAGYEMDILATTL